MLTLRKDHFDEVIRQARIEIPNECCGLIGGHEHIAKSIYPLNNVAANPLVTYEAAPEALFHAQRLMRARAEELLAIYHSHPRAVEPRPSETDVRLAYYPGAIYLIIALGSGAPIVKAFRISEKERISEPVEYQITDA
jgi:[CysO sulfur-carrier protein]-S-L-cysteine hydrolase